MLALLNKVWRPGLFILGALAFFLGAYFYFFRSSYDPPPTLDIPFETFSAPSSTFSTFVEVPPIQEGVLLVDAAHSNDFDEGEIGSLISRVKDRGYDVEFLGERRLGGFRPPGLGERPALLEEKLREADSFAVVLPRNSYINEERRLVEEFVRKGGKLHLIGDPTRTNEINSLAEGFGTSFRPDYLYNTREYDINHQNIFIREFAPDELTAGLREIVFYTAGSIESSGTGLALAGGNTQSSMIKRIEPFYPMVKAAEGQVLAIHDLTFMVPPQNSIPDNDRLISNIADFLTDSQREFDLADFPHFFKEEVDVLLGRADLFDLGTEARAALSAFGINSDIKGLEDLTRDTLYIGLYEDSADVAQYLGVAGVQVDEALRTPFTPGVALEGTGIILLDRTQERHVLVLLGDSRGSVLDMLGRLVSGRYRRGMVSDSLGVYRSF